jgi:hypothetical protein
MQNAPDHRAPVFGRNIFAEYSPETPFHAMAALFEKVVGVSARRPAFQKTPVEQLGLKRRSVLGLAFQTRAWRVVWRPRTPKRRRDPAGRVLDHPRPARLVDFFEWLLNTST